MDKQGYPHGTPPEFCARLQAWWEEELRQCDLRGMVTVQHVPVQAGPLPAQSLGKALYDAWVAHQSSVANTHLYHAQIPSLPWPMETAVLTTEEGFITNVIYRTLLRCGLSGEVLFRLKVGLMGGRSSVAEGPSAERFREQGPLLKKIGEAISSSYQVPLWGFHASKKLMTVSGTSLTLRPGPEGCEAILRTTVRAESAFVGYKYSLGLDRLMEVLKALEHGLGAQ